MIQGIDIRLLVANLDRAVRFYVETLGLKLIDEKKMTSSEFFSAWAEMDLGQGSRLILMHMNHAAPSTSVWSKPGTSLDLGAPHIFAQYTFLVQGSLSGVVDVFENRGVPFLFKSESLAIFHDPDGHHFGLASHDKLT